MRVDLVSLPAGGGLDLGGVDCGKEDGEAVVIAVILYNLSSILGVFLMLE